MSRRWLVNENISWCRFIKTQANNWRLVCKIDKFLCRCTLLINLFKSMWLVFTGLKNSGYVEVGHEFQLTWFSMHRSQSAFDLLVFSLYWIVHQLTSNMWNLWCLIEFAFVSVTANPSILNYGYNANFPRTIEQDNCKAKELELLRNGINQTQNGNAKL